MLTLYSIVAVHGLGGDSYATWTTGDTLWLRDLLPSLFDNPRILTFGYDARAFLSPSDRSRSTGRAFTFAESLLSDLDDWRVSPSVSCLLIGKQIKIRLLNLKI